MENDDTYASSTSQVVEKVAKSPKRGKRNGTAGSKAKKATVKSTTGISKSYSTIAAVLNTKNFSVNCTRRYCRERLDRLLKAWKNDDKKERRVTGGGDVPPETESDKILKFLAEEEDKGTAIVDTASEKKGEDVEIVKAIQQKAMLTLREKDFENSDEDEETTKKRQEEKETAFYENGGTQEEWIAQNSMQEETEKPDQATEAKGPAAVLKKGKAKVRSNRATLVDQMVKEKGKVEIKWRGEQAKAQKERLEFELADKEEERCLRQKQMEFDREKLHLDHGREMKKQETDKAEKDRLYSLLAQAILPRGNGQAQYPVYMEM